MSIIIGVDNGNFNTKTVSHLFTTSLTESSVPLSMASDLIEFNGHFYSLSSKRALYERDKTKTVRAFILTLFSIAKELKSRIERGEIEQSTSYDVVLAVGLPPGHMKAKDEFRNYFLKYGQNIEFFYNREQFIIHLDDVLVFPQAYAAFSSHPTNLSRYERCYIIDIGGYTTDVLLMVDRKPDLSQVYSLDYGMIHLFNKIKRDVSFEFSLAIDDAQISDVLHGKPHILKQDVVLSIYNSCENYFDDILGQLRELGIELRTTPAVFVGGGSIALKESIENSDFVEKADHISDISANALGYEILAKVMMRSRQKQAKQ